MSEITDTIEYKGYTINIKHDDMAESPRVWDNLGKMVYFHSRYNLGDKHNYKTEDFDGWKGMSEYLIKEEGALVILPLYLYDHSGITMSTGAFSCPWDSGQVGFIYVSKKKLLEEYGGERVTKKTIELATKALEGAVELYDHYLRGNVFYFVVKDNNGEQLDGCSEFYGYDWKENGLLEHAENAIDCEIVSEEKKAEKDRLWRVKKVKALVRNRVPLERRWA